MVHLLVGVGLYHLFLFGAFRAAFGWTLFATPNKRPAICVGATWNRRNEVGIEIECKLRFMTPHLDSASATEMLQTCTGTRIWSITTEQLTSRSQSGVLSSWLTKKKKRCFGTEADLLSPPCRCYNPKAEIEQYGVVGCASHDMWPKFQRVTAPTTHVRAYLPNGAPLQEILVLILYVVSIQGASEYRTIFVSQRRSRSAAHDAGVSAPVCADM